MFKFDKVWHFITVQMDDFHLGAPWELFYVSICNFVGGWFVGVHVLLTSEM